MGDEYMKEDRQVHKEIFCEPRREPCYEPSKPDCRPECKPDCRKEPCRDDDCGIGNWIPLIAIGLLVFGGNLFGGKEDCCESGGTNWILILVVLFCLCGNQNGREGGLLGGLFGC